MAQTSLHILTPQIVGNLLYYRYMNPAIVAPDAFDIIEVSAGGQLTTEQRRNLGSVAKMLQHAASNKMFLGDNAHLNPINEYLSASHQKFRSGATPWFLEFGWWRVGSDRLLPSASQAILPGGV